MSNQAKVSARRDSRYASALVLGALMQAEHALAGILETPDRLGIPPAVWCDAEEAHVAAQVALARWQKSGVWKGVRI